MRLMRLAERPRDLKLTVPATMSRIGPVFTPPTLRGQGYGSAVTAAAAQHALLTGAKHVVLVADLANPVSNSIYQRIGFEPVARTVEIAVNRCQGSGPEVSPALVVTPETRTDRSRISRFGISFSPAIHRQQGIASRRRAAARLRRESRVSARGAQRQGPPRWYASPMVLARGCC
jgi:hypothetical protein